MDKLTGRQVGCLIVLLVGTYVVLPSIWRTQAPSLKRYTTGLANGANYCYANSTLQALAALPRLEKWLETQGDSPWILELRQTLNILRDETHSSPFATTLRPLFQVLQVKLQSYMNHSQQDAHELLLHMIDLMEAECGDDSPFAGEVEDSIRCLNCNFKKTHKQRTTVFERQPGDKMLAPETELISGYRCENCDKVVTIEKKSEISKAPDLLVIHLNRSSMIGGQTFRSNREAEIPSHIGLYSLRSVVFHKGYHSNGHYTCARRKAQVDGSQGRTKCWWQISDEVVKEASESQTLSRKKEAYLMFFEKRNTNYNMSTIKI